jgi:hypothetical protein
VARQVGQWCAMAWTAVFVHSGGVGEKASIGDKSSS